MTVTSEQMRFLTQIHRHGPQYLRDARRERGEALVEVMLRTHHLRRYRLPDGDVLTLGARARRALGLNPTYTKPSTASLRQQVTRGKVIQALERQGFHLVEHRNPYVSVMEDPRGRRTLVAVNHKGYSSRTLRRLVGETLRTELLGGVDLLVVDPHAKRLEHAAQDHQHLFNLISLERVTAPPN